MLRASGAGAYSQGIACPSPSPHELGADEALVRATVRSVLTGALWHPGRVPQELACRAFTCRAGAAAASLGILRRCRRWVGSRSGRR